MTNIWTFSPTSQELLQSCLNLVTPQNNANKWYRKMGRKPCETVLTPEILEQDVGTNNQKDIIKVEKESGARETEEIDENFLENIELNPTANFDEIVEGCMKNNNLFSALASRLSSSAVEKILNHIFNTKKYNMSFIELMHKKFLHEFLKRNQTWLSLDLLVKSNKTYPDIFMDLFRSLLQDTDVPRKLLQDFIATVNDEEKSIFFNNMIGLEYSKQQFDNNLQLIHTSYKDCKKNTAVQSYIVSIILAHSQDFANDKNFGKFLLSFLQAQANIGGLRNYSSIEKLIENHRTPFKKPCLNVLKEIIEKYKV